MSPLRPFLPALGAERWRLTLGAGLLLLTSLSGIGLLALAGWFITATGITAMLIAAGIATQLNIYAPGAGIRAFAVIRTVSRYFERVHNHDAVLRLLAGLRTRVFASLAGQPLPQLARLHSSTLLNRLTADVDTLDQLYLRCLAPTLVAVLSVLAISLLLGAFAPWLGLLLAATLLTGFVLLSWLGDRLGRHLGETLVANRETTRLRLIEALQGLAELRAFGAWLGWQQQLSNTMAELQASQTRTSRNAAIAEAAAGWLVQMTAVIVFAMALWLYQQGQISAAVATLMPLAVLGLAEVLAPLPGAFLRLGQTRAAAARLGPYMAPAGASTSAGTDGSATAPALELEQLCLERPDRATPVLRDFSLAVAAGEHVAITGPSGCGKSSLADACSGLLLPTSGRILLRGQPLPNLHEAELFRRLGYLRQRSELFDDSIAANLRLGCPDASEARLWWALEQVALAADMSALPEGLDTWIGENGVRLSGGQARRLALARLLLREPELVLLDEPLSSLDAATARVVAGNLERWLQGRTAIMFGHAEAALPAAHRSIQFPRPSL